MQEVVWFEAQAAPPLELGDAVDDDEELAADQPRELGVILRHFHLRALWTTDPVGSNARVDDEQPKVVHQPQSAEKRGLPPRNH